MGSSALPLLELPQDTLEQRVQRLRGGRIEDLAHVRVARGTLNPIDRVQIVL